jgi:MYXO-CTERM domain-containing protein
MHALLRPLMPALLGACAAAAQANVSWDETTQGDFAGNGLAPTGIVLVQGSNLVLGSTGRTAGVVDRDYFSFTLPAGWQLDTITVLPGSSFLGTGAASFIAVQAGPQVTVNPTGGSPEGLLGWVHYSENDVGTDILGLMGIGPGATGFAGALPAGTYSFWVQDTGTGVANFRFDFAVSAVPEPAGWALALAGVAGLAGWRARRQPAA